MNSLNLLCRSPQMCLRLEYALFFPVLPNSGQNHARNYAVTWDHHLEVSLVWPKCWPTSVWRHPEFRTLIGWCKRTSEMCQSFGCQHLKKPGFSPVKKKAETRCSLNQIWMTSVLIFLAVPTIYKWYFFKSLKYERRRKVMLNLG